MQESESARGVKLWTSCGNCVTRFRVDANAKITGFGPPRTDPRSVVVRDSALEDATRAFI